MKKLTRWAVMLGLCLSLLVCGALAAEGEIQVQLDGEAITFTDATPQVKDNRTFLPFRAVFEALGAEVDAEDGVITAKRGDKTLIMTPDSTEAVVVEDGLTTPIQMDVAPYVDESVYRTYVPVRFAAQAFDCTVGWDQEAMTAIIVDTEKLIAQATEGKTYHYLEQASALSNEYQEGIWSVDGAVNGDMTVNGAALSLDGRMSGTMEGVKEDLTVNMKVDMSALLNSATATSSTPLDAKSAAALDALKTDGISVTMRGDLDEGTVYANTDLGALSALTGAENASDTWYSMDMHTLMNSLGMNWNAIFTRSREIGVQDLLSSFLRVSVTIDSAADGYASVKSIYDELFAAFADDRFTFENNTYTAKYVLAQEEDSVTVTLKIG